jgi:hypothetical protein
LDCGVLENVFARVRCDDRGHEYLLPFSCKRRHFCPSCHQKQVVEFGEWLWGEVEKAGPHRHVVFGIAKIIRRYFLLDRRVLSDLSRYAREAVGGYLRGCSESAGAGAGWKADRRAAPAQGAQDAAGQEQDHPRAHRPDGKLAAYGLQHVRRPQDPALAPAVHGKSGTPHHSGVVFPGAGDLCAETAEVVCRSKDGSKVKVFDALEWLAAMCSHVPNKGAHMVRYYGYYSKVSKAYRGRTGSPNRISGRGHSRRWWPART